MKKRITVAEEMVHRLRKEGINYCFCVPGESYLPLLDALHNDDEMKLISTRHEGGAAFMAEAYAKCTQKPGVVLATRGVGASNLAIGVHTAYQDSTPMIVILGQVHRKVLGKEGFQEIDLPKYFEPIAKWTIEITDPERISEIMAKAVRIALSGRPGPVVISIPEDVFNKEIEPTTNHIKFNRSTPQPSQNELKRVMKLLKSARAPLLIAGGGIKSAHAEKELREFSEIVKLPVFVSFRRHDIFPHNHEHFSGHLGLSKSNHTEKIFTDADVIIALGTRLSEVTTKNYSLINSRHKIIHIDIDDRILGKSFEPEIGIVADAKEALQSFTKMAFDPPWKTWTNKVRQSFESERRTIAKVAESTFNTFVIKTLEEKLPKDSLLTNDAGNFASWLHEFYTFQLPHTYVGPTSGAMGYGLPAAIGSKIAYPHKKVVALAGDGGFMMTAQEIETAVRYHIPVICLVFNNRMYGTIRMHQEIHYPNRVIGTDLGEISFSQLAESMGALGFTVETKEQFTAAFEHALKADKVTVIEIITDREQINVQQTIHDIRNY